MSAHLNGVPASLTPAANDVLLVKVGDEYSILRCTGVGTTAYRRDTDAAAPMPREFGMALARGLAASERVALWMLQGSMLSFIQSYRR